MISKNTIVVFDFETGSVDPSRCELLQIGAVALDPRSLQEVDHYEALVRPVDPSNVEDEALAVNRLDPKKFMAAPERAAVWADWGRWIKQFNRPGGVEGRPIAAGKNIHGFDWPIVVRLCGVHGPLDKNGTPGFFHPRRRCDLEELLWQWFESDPDMMPKLSMDCVRDTFGLSKEGAHSALVDARQTAQMIARFLGLHRRLKEANDKDGNSLIKWRN